MEAEKGAPLTDAEGELLEERTRAARAWLDAYAPERARIEVRRDALPPSAADLDADQRGALSSLAGALATAAAWDGESLQAAIFDAARNRGLPAGRMFAALYLVVPGPAERPARRLAARVAAPGLRRRAASRRIRGGYAHRMISLQLIRDDPDAVKRAIARKGEAPDAVDRLVAADARRRELEAEANDLRAERNAGNRELGALMRDGQRGRGGRAEGADGTPLAADRRHDRGAGHARIRDRG